MKNWFVIILYILLCECQNNVKLQIDDTNNNNLEYAEKTLEMLEKEIHKLSCFYNREISDTLLNKISYLQSSEKFSKIEIDQMDIPFLHPNGNSSKDISLKNIFFDILEMMETLRYLLENYNKFIIHTNLNFLTHPAQVHNSFDLNKMINYRKTVQKEILFVNNAIKNYNKKINVYFPSVSHNHKMAGYYSFDNSHFGYNQDEFSIEDVDNFSFSYHQRLVSKNVLKHRNARAQLKKPEVGTRRGTVFITPGKPNILRGAFGNDFGAYDLGVAVGMTIEYAITGKIYYYKGSF